MTLAIETIAAPDLTREGLLSDCLLALNNAHEVELSRLTADRMRRLATNAFVATRIGSVEAFLIAFDQGADYDSPNFLWFRGRLARFVYVDRVVVAESSRGLGHARRLYFDLFARARRAGHDCIVCEVNSTPPNPGSDAFHAAMGFGEIGAMTIHDGAKSVRYLMRELGPS